MKVTIEVPDQIAQEFNQIAQEKGYKNGIHYLKEFVRGRLFEARMAKRDQRKVITEELETEMPNE